MGEVKMLCQCCGAAFKAKRLSAKYCPQSACKQAAYRKRVNSMEPKKPKIHCKWCGSSIIKKTKGRPPEFCDDNHRVLWFKALRRAIKAEMLRGTNRVFGPLTNDQAEDQLDLYKPSHWLMELRVNGYEYVNREFVDKGTQAELPW